MNAECPVPIGTWGIHVSSFTQEGNFSGMGVNNLVAVQLSDVNESMT